MLNSSSKLSDYRKGQVNFRLESEIFTPTNFFNGILTDRKEREKNRVERKTSAQKIKILYLAHIPRNFRLNFCLICAISSLGSGIAWMNGLENDFVVMEWQFFIYIFLMINQRVCWEIQVCQVGRDFFYDGLWWFINLNRCFEEICSQF